MKLYTQNLLGDTLLFTPAIRTWKNVNPDGYLEVHCSKAHGSHLLLYDNPYIDRLKVVGEGEYITTCSVDDPFIVMDASVAYTHGVQNNKSLAWGYGKILGLDGLVNSTKYDYKVAYKEEQWAMQKLQELDGLTPGNKRLGSNRVVLVARHSASCSSNDPRIRVANKCVANRMWVQVAKWLKDNFYIPVAIGSSKDAEDSRYAEWPGPKLYGEDIRNIAALTKHSHLTLSVDCGIRHLTAAAGGNLYCQSGAIPLWLINCKPARRGQVVIEDYKSLPTITVSHMIRNIESTLQEIKGDK